MNRLPNFRFLYRGAKFLLTQKRLPSHSEIIRSLNLRLLRMPLPTFIQLEPTTRCNFNCIMCTRRSLNKKRLNADLTLREFIKIVKQIPTLKKIKLQGFGEPLLNPYIWEILHYGKGKGISFTTTTNGFLVGEYLREIVMYFDEIILSMDSMNKFIFENIRRGGNFDKIIEGLIHLIECKKKFKSQIRIGINMVVHSLNFKEIPQLVGMAKRIGVDFVSIVEVENWKTPLEDEYAQDRLFIDEARKVSDRIRKLVTYVAYKNPDFPIYFLSSEKRKKTCYWPFYSCFITVDGYITPCCIRMNPEVINFGNIHENSFAELWNGNEYVLFRKTILKNLPNPICDQCPD